MLVFEAWHRQESEENMRSFESVEEFDAIRGSNSPEAYELFLEDWDSDFAELVGEACLDGDLTLEEAFDLVDRFGDDDDAVVKLAALAECGIVWDYDYLDQYWYEIYVYKGTIEEYAQQYADDIMDIPKDLWDYIDFGAIARDLADQGQYIEFWFGENYVVEAGELP